MVIQVLGVVLIYLKILLPILKPQETITSLIMRPVTIGIVSIGDMGLGMARLLKAHDYRVVTVAEGRRYDSSDGNPTRETNRRQ